MKTINKFSTHPSRAALIVAVSGLAFLATTGLAQEKGAERLLKLGRPRATPASQPASPKATPMSCPQCQDAAVQVPDWNAKGGQILKAGGRPTLLVAKHLCAGCSTTLTVAGEGKAKQRVAQHTCTACGANNKSCCSTVADGKPTAGM